MCTRCMYIKGYLELTLCEYELFLDSVPDHDYCNKYPEEYRVWHLVSN